MVYATSLCGIRNECEIQSGKKNRKRVYCNGDKKEEQKKRLMAYMEALKKIESLEEM